jgi:hypothetical protein
MTYTQVWDHIQGQASDQMIQRDEDGAFIPFDADNIDYQAYLAWVAEGNKATPYVPSNVPPSTGESAPVVPPTTIVNPAASSLPYKLPEP